MSISENLLEEVAHRLICKAAVELPASMKKVLQDAYENEDNDIARSHLKAILKSSDISATKKVALCQDTGVPMFFLELGTKCMLEGNPTSALERAVKQATEAVPLRHNIVNPITHKNTDTNTGYGIPVISTDLVDGADYLDILAVTKGLGSEARTALSEVLSSEDIDKAVKKCALDLIREIMGDPCPPIIIGIGIGGVPDYNLKIAKKALFRDPIGSHNKDPAIAKLEKDLYEAINYLRIGPMGFGGKTYALAVHAEMAGSHTGVTPVCVTLQCWAHRYSRARIYNNGKVDYITHPLEGANHE